MSNFLNLSLALGGLVKRLPAPTRVVVLPCGPAVASGMASGRMTVSWAERCAEEPGHLPGAPACEEISQRPVLPGGPGTFGDLGKHLLLCISICWFSYDFEAWRLKVALI